MSNPLTATQPAASTPSHLPASSANTPAPSPAEYWHFISAFLRRPMTVGAVAPSSPALARAMVPPVDLKSAQIVVELGAGTGAITHAIRQRIGHATELAAFELHPDATECLRKKFPGIHVIHDTAENLRQHLDRLGHRHADSIISGLPWSTMSDQLQGRILDAVLASLHPEGVFSVMVYVHSKGLPSSTKFKRKLEARFGRITASPIIWGNLPPAFVYYCEEPRQQ
ncbi:MAG TPA: methyltransferase domain-containing protein [Opitutaceae bacterium]|nr:methyltransferase domain-containing protein [Opitutaceae bacterium]